MDIYAQIRKLRLEGESQRQIARQLHISRHTVKKYCDGNAVPWEHKTRERQPSVLTDEVVSFVKLCLKEDEMTGLKKQRHTAKRIYDRLVEEKGFTGGESTVRTLVQRLRPTIAEAYVPLAFVPGEAMQIDWGEATVYLDGQKTTVNLFCARLCWSSAPIVIAYRRQNQESFLDAFVHVFDYFGGVVKKVIFDNAKVAVKDGFGKQAMVQKEYAELAAHYGFEAVFCNPDFGNEKGLVEGLVGFARRNMCVPMPKARTLSELNMLLREKCQAYLKHQIRGKEASVGEMYAAERPQLRPLPGYHFDAARRSIARVNRFSTVRFDTNDYSVPVAYCGQEVSVKGLPETIQIFKDGAIIAEHPRCFARHKPVYDLKHYLPILERKGRAIPNARPVQDNVSPEFLSWLTRQERKPKELVELLQRCLEEGCDAVMNGTSALPKEEFPSTNTDPGPQVPPVNLGAYDDLCSRGKTRNEECVLT